MRSEGRALVPDLRGRPVSVNILRKPLAYGSLWNLNETCLGDETASPDGFLVRTTQLAETVMHNGDRLPKSQGE